MMGQKGSSCSILTQQVDDGTEGGGHHVQFSHSKSMMGQKGSSCSILPFLVKQRSHLNFTLHRLACQTQQISEDGPVEALMVSVQGESISCFSFSVKEHDSHINVTVTDMKVGEKSNMFCLYGGFVTAELSDLGWYKESNILCENISEKATESRSFYSQGSTLDLLLFWYSQLITAKTSVSVTHCKAAVIDLCFLSHCWTRFDLSFLRDCSPYIRSILEGLGMDVILHYPFLGALENRPSAQLDVGKQNCVVFQFRRDVKELYRHAQNPASGIEHCSIRIKFQSPALEKVALEKVIRVGFKGSLSPVHSKPQCRQFNELVDPKQHNLTHCGYFHQLQLESNSVVYRKMMQFHLIPGCSATKFVGSFQILPPAHHLFFLIFPKHADTWVDIILQKTSDPGKHETHTIFFWGKHIFLS